MRGTGAGEGEGARDRAAARPARAAPKNSPWEPEQEKEEQERRQRTRDKMRAKLEAGELEDRVVELNVEQKAVPVQIFSNLGMENMDVDLQGMFDKMMPKNASRGRCR
jgi:ATP-dependent HslUV protease ATP-binding subunit HslU